MADWGVHLLDYAMKGMNVGLPSYVYGAGGKYAYPDDAMETPDTLMAIYKYPDFNIIWDHACGIATGLYGQREGVAFLGENGTLILTRSGWEVLPEQQINSRNFPTVTLATTNVNPTRSEWKLSRNDKGADRGCTSTLAICWIVCVRVSCLMPMSRLVLKWPN